MKSAMFCMPDLMIMIRVIAVDFGVCPALSDQHIRDMHFDF